MTDGGVIEPVLSVAAATEKLLLDALYRQYQQGRLGAAVIRHVPLGLAYKQKGFRADQKQGAENTIRYIDALVLFKDKRWAVEVKVSKADLKRELETPAKSVLWRAHTNAFYFLVPPEMVDHATEVIPPGSGILTLDPDSGGTVIVRRAKTNREPVELPEEMWRRLAARLGQLQSGIEPKPRRKRRTRRKTTRRRR
ncbi:hypothetical protein [Aeromicrobium sp. 179-A 4D2 NHS]|uniref:hypothetical protein n=1 Tax=Aeromicrobium sp. 179-A 4D2 NHS TaxID=3142375 RepID=UPI0039A10CD0